MSRKWYKITAVDESAEISIFGDIGASWWGESVTLADFKKDFDSVKDKASIKVLLNSPGGDVWDGMGIYNLLSSVRQKVTVEVLGLAASIASIIALAGRELVMGEGSYFMIHKAWTFAMGNAAELRETADLLDKVDGQMFDIYEQHTDMTEEELAAAIAETTWYTAEEAVEAGFANSVVDYGQIAASCNLPEQIVASYDLSKYKYAHVPIETIGSETPSDKPADIREFEARVRGMGFSKRESTAIASHGFAHRDDADPEAEQTPGEKQGGSPSASLLILFHEEEPS